MREAFAELNRQALPIKESSKGPLLGMATASTLIMKINLYMPLLIVGATFAVCSCSTSNDGRPIPGTLEATSTKDNSNINNTPRNNPTPNPDPDSQPPDQVTRTVVH